MPATRPAATDAQIDDLVRAILAGEPYASFRLEHFDVLRWLSEALDSFFLFIGALYENNPGLYWVLVALLGTTCALVLTHMVWTLLGALRVAPASSQPDAAAAELDFAAEAGQLAEQGAHLEAAHKLLLGSLRTLAQRRHIPLHPEDGNARVCRQLERSKLPAPLRNQLIGLIAETERAWFGDPRDVDGRGQALYRAWRAAHEQLLRTAVT